MITRKFQPPEKRRENIKFPRDSPSKQKKPGQHSANIIKNFLSPPQFRSVSRTAGSVPVLADIIHKKYLGQPANGSALCLSPSISTGKWSALPGKQIKPYICRVPSVPDSSRDPPTPLTCPQCPYCATETTKVATISTRTTPTPTFRCSFGWTYINVAQQCWQVAFFLMKTKACFDRVGARELRSSFVASQSPKIAPRLRGKKIQIQIERIF